MNAESSMVAQALPMNLRSPKKQKLEAPDLHLPGETKNDKQAKLNNLAFGIF